MRVRTCLLLLAAAFSLACGDAPKPVRGGARPIPSPADTAGLPGGHPELPAVEQTPGIRLDGEVVLVGELADRDAGFFYVSVRASESRSTWLTRRYAMGDTEVQDDGTRRLAFELVARDPDGLTFDFAPDSPGPPAPDCEVHVRLSEEPYVESAVIAESAQPFAEGTTRYQLVLELDG